MTPAAAPPPPSRRRQDGGPAAEFALVAPIFIVVIFATVQCAIIYICQRLSRDGDRGGGAHGADQPVTTLDYDRDAQFQTAVCANMPALFTCGSVMVGLQPATSTTSISTAAPAFNADGTLANSLPYQQPTAGQIGVLQVMYQWPVIGLPLGFNFANLGNGTYLMMSTQVFMVEQSQ